MMGMIDEGTAQVIFKLAEAFGFYGIYDKLARNEKKA
jgi:hypothetical protein